MKKQVFILNFFVSIFFLNSFAATPLKKMPDKPNLVVVLVIDQFRADYLTRFEKRFLPAKTANGIGGFKYLTSQGAYFPFAEYEVLQSMTCPGHAMILTGAYPALNGIVLNEWYDKVARKEVYCAEDPKHGLSPKNLLTTTVGDELKNAGYKSKVIGIALKDRSGIMLAGHRGDQVYWMDDKNFQWTTSTYYSPEGSLPKWVTEQNDQLKKKVGTDYVWESKATTTGLTENSEGPFKKVIKLGDKESLSYPIGATVSMDLAMSAVKELKLGRGAATDILAISISSHDMLGHHFGPNSREMEEMTIAEDQIFSKFFSFLEKQGLLKNSVIVLTADHGVAPATEYSVKSKIDAERLSTQTMIKNINEHLDNKFGKPKKGPWIIDQSSLNFYFDRSVLAEKKVDLDIAEKEAKSVLLDEPGVWFVVTSTESRGQIPLPEILKTQFLNQYNIEHGGDLIAIPKPYSIPAGSNYATHITGFSYDRTVPLIFAGKNIRPGVYPEKVKVLDIAPTLSFMLGIVPPATSFGKVLEIF